jgi:hypothetical protein
LVVRWLDPQSAVPTPAIPHPIAHGLRLAIGTASGDLQIIHF